MNDNLYISENGKNILIKYYEGLHDGDLSEIGLQPKPCPADIWTVGWGHAVYDSNLKRQLKSTIKGDFERIPKEFLNLTEEEAESLLSRDLSTYEKIVKSNLKIEVNQNQFDALVSHNFNCGTSNTLYELINGKSSKDKIVNWWTNKYISSGGVVLNGLIARRKKECDLYFS